MLELQTSQVKDILAQQRNFFSTGKTKDVAFRIAQLKRLKEVILENDAAILEGLKADLHKAEFESYATEIILVQEIDHTLKHIKSWVKPKRVPVSMANFPGSGQIYPEPLGVVLIISPWNYPFALAIAPLVGAIAAGNCCVIKPSEISPHTSGAIAEIIQKNFDPGYIAVVQGGVETSQELLAEKFDHILFTGSTQVGKIIMTAAAKHLTPVTLELGGKSPCIVETDVPIETTAKRIVWGKFLNAGQTCVAPDYLLVNREIKSDLLEQIKACIHKFYGDDPAKSPDYARIISDKHYHRLSTLLKDGEIIIGGQTNPEDRYIAPTVIDNISLEDKVMEEEIFGPILPVIEYSNLDEAIGIVNQRPKPLALYFFSRDKAKQQQVLQQTSAGGVCLNETVMHLNVPSLPFGGVGDSGMGAYHGKAGFDTFSHQKSVLKKSFWLDLQLRYAPYKDKLEQIKKFISG
ncbi:MULTISPECIES: aldehyde dehydrogenase [unclassified Moorena]|uniref:aldehyde dehydrogenase n=1 Tax=unclassified Moorena TaxID=2683338 RepID=UPI0013CA8B2C|nr:MULTISPECIES: aldehyde dehydrogenase [unclassified Moorena]NEO20255.1 aldehyde dehydrogenase [Moorena sp. SIO4A5]NEP22704.1 aldehyde dehydrogenase [Moorena sp. SIO3I6]NEQ56347.1 aldehyde dehydrogenase [Moorena sp. SIO4A1]